MARRQRALKNLLRPFQVSGEMRNAAVGAAALSTEAVRACKNASSAKTTGNSEAE
jgi:hypothetical protein